MNHAVRNLFHELVELSDAERDRVFADRQTPPEVRAEVESLLEFDRVDGDSLTGRVASAAVDAVHSAIAPPFDQCGRYRLVRLLGSGGMGAVYLAERSDGEIQRKAAVKLLRAGADRPAWRARFLKERQILASLNHPAIAHLLDAGHTSDGRPYLVMEYVEGVPIDEYAAGRDLRDQLALFVRVCEGVSHAHSHLVIHRDLKPSNILVDASGQPKVLDFGIARLLDEAGDITQTVERLLTPSYASPEQLCGTIQTTASDVYSLGAVLYKLLTGRSPHGVDTEGSRGSQQITGPANTPAPSRINPALPVDIDYIVRKALRAEPQERYPSVEAFADDVRAFLAWKPVEARSGDTWYRSRKFLRRYRAPVIATALTIAGLAAGLWVANRERDIAQRRFLQVRQLANKVLALDPLIRGLPGSTKARHELVAMSQEYLEALRTEAHADQNLALEIGIAYLHLATAQGVPSASNLGLYAQAEESLRKADALLEPILSASHGNRAALLATAEVAHARMILAETDRRRDEAVVQARKAAERLDILLDLGKPSESEANTAAQVFLNVSLSHKNMHRLDDAGRAARRALEIAQPIPSAQRFVAGAWSLIADIRRLSGDLEGAFEAGKESLSAVDKAAFTNDVNRRTTLFAALWRQGLILGEEGSISLNRPEEATSLLQRALDLSEEGAARDPNDAAVRIHVASAARELGDILRHRDPNRALAVYSHGLSRLSEIKDNAKARREEVHLLAGSSYALRNLKRNIEAKQRIDTAFRVMRETKDYPADRVDPGSPVDTALRALADHLAETGLPRDAADVYRQLLEKIMATQPDPRTDLRHAVKLSAIYEALAELHRRDGQPDLAKTQLSLRREIWSHWDQKLPNNPFVRRQIEATR